MFLPATITLKSGDTGDFVTELQRRLVAVNCFAEGMVSGFYDGNTVNAVRSFQGMHGLQADGVAGPDTLRRLNGVIAGDTGGSAAPKDDPKESLAVAPDAAAQTFMWGTAPPIASAAAPLPPVREEVAALSPAAVSEAVKPVEMAPRREEVQAAIAVNAAPPAPAESLTAMFAPPHAAAMAAQAASTQAGGAIPIAERPSLSAMAGAAQAGQMGAAAVASAASAPLAVNASAEAEAAPQRQGMLGRAMQMANAMLQKLADYFEAKLPPSVLKEVQDIGQHMARNGVKELPIPGTPSAPAQELPGRAQEPVKAR